MVVVENVAPVIAVQCTASLLRNTDVTVQVSVRRPEIHTKVLRGFLQSAETCRDNMSNYVMTSLFHVLLNPAFTDVPMIALYRVIDCVSK
jgi:hypothetical protein